MARTLKTNRHPLPALAVQLEGEWARVAVRRGGETVVRACREEDGGLPAALVEAGADAGGCVLVLPRSRVLVGARVLPAADAAELGDMAALQAPLALPVPIEQTVWDAYLKWTDGGKAHIDVLAVAAEEAAAAIGRAEAAGLRVERAVFGPLSLMAHYRRLVPADSEEWAFIDAGEAGVEMGVCGGGRLLFSRSLRFEGERGALAREYRRMLVALGREGRAARPTVLAVGGPRGQEAADRLRQEGQEALLVGDEPSAALRGALEDADPEVDLTPPALRGRLRRRALGAQLGRAGLLVAACLGLLWAGGSKQVHDRQAYLGRLEEARRALAPRADSLRAMQRILAAARQQSDPGASGLAALAELAPHLPAGTALESFSFEVGDRAEISGTGPSMSTVFQQLVPALQASGRFAGVQVHSAAKIGESDRVSFHIGLRLGPGGGP